MENIIFIALVVVLLLLALFIVPRWRVKRAAGQVIWIFREHNAVDVKNAKTIDELGLRPRGMMEGMFKGRDFKPYALSAMMKAEIVRGTEDGRLYLLEDKLIASGFNR